MIPYGKQSITDQDVDAVVDALRSDFLTQGPTTVRFEDAFREYVGADYAVAFSSGTAALHGAAWAAGLGPQHTVVTSPLTFAASANAARYVGARLGLVDVELSTYGMNLGLVEAGVAASIPVHFAGLPISLEESRWLARPPVVIEDAAHALGAETPSGKVGNCRFSDMTCFSFHPVKAITTGEGGMVTTNSSDLAHRLRLFRNHGISRPDESRPWDYQIIDHGFNYRLTDLQSALGISQLSRLDHFIDRRNEIASAYRSALEHSSNILLPPRGDSGIKHAYHLFPIRVKSKEQFITAMFRLGIRVQVHYIPIHKHPLFRKILVQDGPFPNADSIFEEVVSLPMFPGLTDDNVEYVIKCTLEAAESA